MFNFFGEVKKHTGVKVDEFHIINISNKLLYVEGHKGLVILSSELVAFKVKNGRIEVEGRGLYLKELTENTLKISGDIKRVESFWKTVFNLK